MRRAGCGEGPDELGKEVTTSTLIVGLVSVQQQSMATLEKIRRFSSPSAGDVAAAPPTVWLTTRGSRVS